jgi:Sulfotransferase domain
MNTAPETKGSKGRKAKADDVTFLMVGCQRCGSTWVYEALKEHPEVFLPAAKQTHFFDLSYENSMDWYLDHFDNLKPIHKAVGEVATSYCLPEAIPLMAKELPNIKIIMVMRNPIERANSFYRSRAPHEDWKSFDDALNNDPEILSRGQYIDQIEILLNHYTKDQILFLFYDDLQKDERAYISQIYKFLGVDSTFEPSVIGNPIRAAMFPRLRRILRQMGLTPLVNLVNKSFVGDMLRRYIKKKQNSQGTPNNIPQHIEEKLRKHFQPYNKRLAEFSGRNLGSW